MATAGVINSTLFALYANVSGTYTKVAHGQDVTLTVTQEPRDITTKDSAGYRELLEGLRSWSGSGTFLVAEDATYGFPELYDALINRTRLQVRFSTAVAGDTMYTGTVYVTSIDINSPGAEDNVSASVSFEGTGQISKQTVT